MSNIKVFVHWENSTVFAGENAQCKIIFKNVTPAPSLSLSTTSNSVNRGHRLGRARQKSNTSVRLSSDQPRSVSASVAESLQPRRPWHDPTIPLNARVEAVPHRPSIIYNGTTAEASPENGTHKRSVSIVSVRGDTQSSDEYRGVVRASLAVRPARRHGRAASLQVFPSRAGVSSTGPLSAPLNLPGTTLSPPLLRASTASVGFATRPYLSSLRNHRLDLKHDSEEEHTLRNDKHSSSSISSPFKFPQAASSRQGIPVSPRPLIKEGSESWTRSMSPAAATVPEGEGQTRFNVRPRSPSSKKGTPRTSTDYYSMSNKSTETLISEHLLPNNGRTLFRVSSRNQSHPATVSQSGPSETLMMGYVQLMGSFTLDGSLVNQAPFEGIKQKGVIGGQGGGGVVGVESSKRDSSLFGALGWKNIGESLGGLLGGGAISSIKEMKGVVNAKAIPIMLTPQKILFVDLRLEPGESSTYSYIQPLPRGIPPTYKGRAIKIGYNLVIGTQRPQRTMQQHEVRRVDVPFRVLNGINGRGEILGHDLMSPHILLVDNARSSILDDSSKALPIRAEPSAGAKSSADDFLVYVENLLAKKEQDASLGLLSPTEAPRINGHFESDNHVRMKDAIDSAILKSNLIDGSNHSPNRYEIKREGTKVAVIVLQRPAYRVGETISAIVDFQGAEVSCHFLHISLETSEIVDPAIALRSSASIQRATRRVHTSWSEDTISAKRATFTAAIPANGTPEFVTSGISLQWHLRFEFITGSEYVDASDGRSDGLLEEIERDERGKVLAAIQGLQCDSFDVSVPIQVFGAAGAFDEQHNSSGFPI